MVIPSGARNLLFPLPPPRHKPKPHNRPHRRTLPCLPRAPNLLSTYWPVFRPVGLRLHNLPLPPLQPPPPHHLPFPRPHLLARPFILSVAKDLNSTTPPRLPTNLNPPAQRNRLSPLHPPLSPLVLSKIEGATRRLAHPLAQVETPPGGTPATSTIPPTAISFRCNTYKPARKC